MSDMFINVTPAQFAWLQEAALKLEASPSASHADYIRKELQSFYRENGGNYDSVRHAAGEPCHVRVK